MPAAAVIPALIAYIKVVAVKKLVVESWRGWGRSAHWVRTGSAVLSCQIRAGALHCVPVRLRPAFWLFYFE